MPVQTYPHQQCLGKKTVFKLCMRLFFRLPVSIAKAILSDMLLLKPSAQNSLASSLGTKPCVHPCTSSSHMQIAVPPLQQEFVRQ